MNKKQLAVIMIVVSMMAIFAHSLIYGTEVYHLSTVPIGALLAIVVSKEWDKNE